jgi:peptidylprolyl isomerase
VNKGVILILLVTAISILGGIIYFASQQPITPPADATTTQNQLSQQPTIPMINATSTPTSVLSIDPAKIYTAGLNTTAGKITIQLNAKQTPITVNNFVTLASKNFYDNTIFHRVIKGFMIQGGDPAGNGSGGPGYNIPDEPVTEDYTRGTIAMANTGQPNTGGSQFFILQENYPLPKTYTIFGHVIQGLEVVDNIANASTSANIGMPGENSKPVSPVSIQSISITEK